MHRLKTPGTGAGDGLARVFQCALAEILGGYQTAFKSCQECTEITICHGVFLQTRPSPQRPFLDSILKLQTFEQYIEEPGVELTVVPLRLEPLRRSEKMYRALWTSGTLSPLGDTESPLGDTESPHGDTESPLGDTESPLGENENSTPMEERLEILNSIEV